MASGPERYTVKAAARLAGVSVRTLHHYDRLGLLRPSGQTEAGYRLYSREDLDRLQQVLFFRELGFELKAIAPILDDPGFDRVDALRRQRKLLGASARRLQTLITTLDRTIESIEKEFPMTADQLFEGFDEQERAQLKAWGEEARERWGHTDAYRQSAERMARYTPADMAAIKAEMQAIDTGLAALMDRQPDDPEVQALVARHYAFQNEKFYDTPIALFRCLADMWVDDPRFTKNIDKTRPGLAAFKRDAVLAFCAGREA